MAHIFIEGRELGTDVRRLIELLADASNLHSAAGDCAPPLDVVETNAGLEVTMDLPGVPAEAIHVAFARNMLVIAGQKLPAACEHREAAFHLAERTFGRFARGIRLNGAYDAGAARARLVAGELHVTLPRIEERRGAEIRIPVRAD